MQTTQEVGTTLNHLIEICRDGQSGFAAAARAIDDPSLQAELIQYSFQRAACAADLEAVLDTLGESAHDGGSAPGAIHRGWINLKAVIAGKDRHAILAECERGQDAAVSAYRDAHSNTYSPSVGLLIESQFDQVQRVHDRIKELRDAAVGE